MNITISERSPKKDDIIKLHQTTGWNKAGLYTNDQLYSGISNSWHTVSIYCNNDLIGFGRIISDGIYQTFICDVMVDPNYQGMGIGKKLIEALLDKCNNSNIKWVQLFSAKGKQHFYQKFGFVERDVDSPGMSLFL